MKVLIRCSNPYYGLFEKEFHQTSILIGRTDINAPVDIDLTPDRTVSRQQARLVYAENKWWLENLSSGRGTYLNGRRVNERMEVTTGAEVEIEQWRFRIFYEVTFRPEGNLPPVQEPRSEELEVMQRAMGRAAADDPRISEMLEQATHQGMPKRPEAYLVALGEMLKRAIKTINHLDVIGISGDAHHLRFEHLIPPSTVPTPISKTLAERVVQSREPLFLSDVFSAVPNAPSVRRNDIGSAMYIPMVAHNNFEGILCIAGTMPASFTPADYTLARIAAFLAASHLGNYRSQYYLRHNTQALNNVKPALPDRLFRLLTQRYDAVTRSVEEADASIVCISLRGLTLLWEYSNSWSYLESLDRVTEQLHDTVEKYGGLFEAEGDTLRAYFGIPDPDQAHPWKAVMAAWEMFEFFRRWHTEGAQSPFQVGIAVDGGPVQHGFLGSDAHMRYAVLGTAVNVAARMAEAHEGEVRITSAAWEKVKNHVEVGRFEAFQGRAMADAVYVAALKGLHVAPPAAASR